MRSGASVVVSLGLCGVGFSTPVAAQVPYSNPTVPPYPGQASEAPRSSLEAGGLRPPGELQEEEAAPSAIEQELARADAEDSGRGLQFVWFNAEVGYQYVDLTAFHDDELLPGFDTGQGGLSFGGGVGVRLLYFTFGARFSYGLFDQWNLWSLLGEAGFRIPYGNFEPYVVVGAGYVALASFDEELARSVAGTSALTAHGIDVRLASGFDYHLSDTFSVGPRIAADLLILSRSSVVSTEPAYAASGSSVGLSVQGTLVAGLHF